jgi:hypothetical protein
MPHTLLKSLICLIIFVNISQSLVQLHYASKNHCSYASNTCFCESNEKIECQNFAKLSNINLSKSRMNDFKLSSIMLHPVTNSSNRTVVLNNELNIDTIEFDMSKFELKLTNFNGIELNENPFHKSTVKNTKRFSYFHYNNSTVQFFYRKKSFDYICDLVLMDMNLTPVFSSFKYLFFGHSKENLYTAPLCPAVFKNARIDWFHVSNLNPYNHMQFIQLNMDSADIDLYLNVRVRYLQIQLSQLECLNSRIVEPHVFKYLERLSIEFSYLKEIERDLFKSFKHLKRLHLWLFNFEEFINGEFILVYFKIKNYYYYYFY